MSDLQTSSCAVGSRVSGRPHDGLNLNERHHRHLRLYSRWFAGYRDMSGTSAGQTERDRMTFRESLKQLHEAATDAPWMVGFEDGSGKDARGLWIDAPHIDSLASVVAAGGGEYDREYGVRRDEDAALIVALRNSTPALIDLLEAAEEWSWKAPRCADCGHLHEERPTGLGDGSKSWKFCTEGCHPHTLRIDNDARLRRALSSLEASVKG